MDNATIISNPSQNATKKKINKNLMAIIIVLVVVALAGVGFGIFGMVMNRKANQKADALNSELMQKDMALKQVEEKLGAQVEVETEASDKEDDAITNVNVSAARDYIYVGEWGIKIKVPEELHSVSYVFYGGRDLLYVSGVVCGNGRCQYYPEFMENTMGVGSGLGALSRYRKDDQSMRLEERDGAKLFVRNDGAPDGGAVVYEDTEYYYTYSRANGFMGDASEIQWERESTDAVEDMLRNGVSAF